MGRSSPSDGRPVGKTLTAYTVYLVGGVAQWLGYRSVAGRLSLIYV